MSTRTLLTSYNFQRKDLKKICAISDPTAQRWLSGDIKPHLMALRLIAMYYQCTPEQRRAAFDQATEHTDKETPLIAGQRQDEIDEEVWQNTLHARAALQTAVREIVREAIKQELDDRKEERLV